VGFQAQLPQARTSAQGDLSFATGIDSRANSDWDVFIYTKCEHFGSLHTSWWCVFIVQCPVQSTRDRTGVFKIAFAEERIPITSHVEPELEAFFWSRKRRPRERF
jgi:hypothetical protein